MITTLLFADQNLMAPNLTQIAKDLGISIEDRDMYLGGYVSLVFFSVGMISSIAAGLVADKANRVWGLTAVTLLGSAACIGTFFVEDKTQFIIVRGTTGISIGGSVPLFYSLIADQVPTKQRGKVTALSSVFMGFGVGAGHIIAGILGPSIGWRPPFLVIGIPTFMLGILLITTTKEPARARKERVFDCLDTSVEQFSYSDTISFKKVMKLLKYPSVPILLLQALSCSFPWGVILVYFNDYISQELQIPVQQSTAIVLAFGVGVTAGQLIAGWLTDKWLYVRPKSLIILSSLCLLCGTAPMIGVLFVKSWPVWIICIICLVVGVPIGIPGGMTKALLMNVTVPEVRGTAFAFNNLVDDLGRGLGPFFVSLIIAAMSSRTNALAVSFSMWGVSAIIILFLIFTYENDLNRTEMAMINNYLKQRLKNSSENQRSMETAMTELQR